MCQFTSEAVRDSNVMFLSLFTVLTIWTIIGTVIVTSSSLSLMHRLDPLLLTYLTPVMTRSYY
jgi:hypothetical protein